MEWLHEAWGKVPRHVQLGQTIPSCGIVIRTTEEAGPCKHEAILQYALPDVMLWYIVHPLTLQYKGETIEGTMLTRMVYIVTDL